jgi:outer membrane lipoprotein-sorting protein
MRYFILTLLVVVCGLAIPVQAQLSSDEKATVQRAETYLQNLKTGSARFVQTAHDGTQLVGTFYIERPGKLRFQYDPPLEDFVVADGVFIYFYDAELEQQTNAPIGQTLADFFLQKEIDLDDGLTVSEIKRGGGLLQIILVQDDDPEAGSLVLGFDEDAETGALTLKKWRIVDGQGLITEIELFYLKTGMVHPKGLFTFVDPNHGKKPNYND